MLAFVANLSLVSVVFMIAFAPMWVARRRRDRRGLEALRAADAAAEREERESVLAALLALPDDPGDTPVRGPGSAAVPPGSAFH